MNTVYAPSFDARTVPYPGDDYAIGYADQLSVAHHACCCSAQPVVVAVFPPTPARDHPTELLLCGHHYRSSQTKLTAAHAKVFDHNGVRVLEDDLPYFPGPARDAVPC